MSQYNGPKSHRCNSIAGLCQDHKECYSYHGQTVWRHDSDGLVAKDFSTANNIDLSVVLWIGDLKLFYLI